MDDGISIIFASFIGIFVGISTGLIPALHPNTVSQFISSLNLQDGFLLAIVIVISAAVNNIVAILPALFLFIPDSDSVLSILPAHRLTSEGKGRLAVKICALSAFFTLLFLLFTLPLFYFLLPVLYHSLKPYIPFFLIAFSTIFILQDKRRKEALFVFLLSGLFGLVVLSSSFSSLLQESLFAAFVGFFALSSIILSFDGKCLIPKQKRVEYKIEIGKKFLAIVFLSTLIGGVADIFPAINSPAQLATFISPIANSPLLFLTSTTSITVSHYANSIIAVERIGKARTGTLVDIIDIVGKIDAVYMSLFLIFYFLGTIIGIFLLIFLSEIVIENLNKINIGLLNPFLFISLFVSVFLFSGIFGLLVSIIAMFLGILPPLLGVRRTHLMAFLIIPSIIILI